MFSPFFGNKGVLRAPLVFAAVSISGTYKSQKPAVRVSAVEVVVATVTRRESTPNQQPLCCMAAGRVDEHHQPAKLI